MERLADAALFARIEARSTAVPECGCWIWMGATYGSGYGAISLNGRQQGAHRAMWEAVHGPLASGALVCHRCDVPLCVNPAHLFAGSDAENAADRNAKGRQMRGRKHWCAKLTEADVRSVRDLIRSGVTQQSVADCFGVRQSQISRIALGHRWKGVKA